MKKIFGSLSIVILASAMIISCESFLDVNTDPTRLKTASLTQTLVSAESSMAFYVGSEMHLYSSIFMQQGAGSGVTGSQTRQMDQYVLANSDVNGIFTNLYAGTIADLNYIRQNAFKENNPQHAGIAKILQAYTYSVLTDAWGNVPYKDAMKGVANVQPAYDDSKEIYDSLFVLIDGGIANIKQTNFLTIGAEDLIYAGDMSKWEKFANTLKLRLALHYANVDGGAKLKGLIDSGAPFMAASTDNFQLSFENVTNRQNPIHQFELSRADYYAPGKFIIDLMNSKLDPRRTAYYTPSPYTTTATGPFVGFTQGSTQSPPNSRIHTYLRGAIVSNTGAVVTGGGAPTATAITYTGAAPQRMLTFAEYNFIRAEAALVYGATGAPATFLKAGIDASIADAGVTASAGTYSTTASSIVTLQNIIEEKYVANVGVPMEPWSDWRRTGFPAISVSTAAIAQGNTAIPRMLVYPLSEQQTNLVHVPTRASMAVKGVFWDK